MASTLPSFASTKETTNYARLCRLLVDVGTQALRDTFDRVHPPAQIYMKFWHVLQCILHYSLFEKNEF